MRSTFYCAVGLIMHCGKKLFLDIRIDSQGTCNMELVDEETRWRILMGGSEGLYKKQIFGVCENFL